MRYYISPFIALKKNHIFDKNQKPAQRTRSRACVTHPTATSAMGFFSQFRLLLWKNFKLQGRRRVRLCQ